MPSIQTVSATKRFLIAAAIPLACAYLGGCSNKEQAAYQLAAQAQQGLEAGDLASARIAIDKALRERDDLVELHLLKGRIELQSKSLPGALVSYSNALSLDPVNQDALQAVAMLGLQTGHTDDAEDATAKLLALSPRNATGLLVKGLIAVERRRYPEALDAANGILAGAPTDESAIILKTRTLFLSGSPQEAIALLNRTIQLVGPSRGFAKISLELARANNDLPAMMKAYATLRTQGGIDGTVAFDEANTHYKSGDRPSGSALVTKALLDEKLPPRERLRMIDLWREYDPAGPARGSLAGARDAAVREGIARYLIELGRLDEAGQLLTGLDGKNAEGLRARALLAGGKLAEARRVAARLIEEDSRQCDALIVQAHTELAEGKTANAVQSGQQAASECPSYTAAWLVTAQAYNTSRQPVQVQRVFRDSLERNPDSQPLHAAFVQWLGQAGKADQAPGVARHLIRYAPYRLSTWRLLASSCGGDQTCSNAAAQGLAKAKTIFQVDRRPGEMAPRGLLASLKTENL